MWRGVLLVLAAIGVGLAVFLIRGGEEEEVRTVPAQTTFEDAVPLPEEEGERQAARCKEGQEPAGPVKERIGSFKRPAADTVPEYEVLQSTLEKKGGVRLARLLVDTRSRSSEDYAMIARDLKAIYRCYPAISAEFTDTSDVLDYRGSALIFNTPKGAEQLGYSYFPPNTRGFVVDAASER